MKKTDVDLDALFGRFYGRRIELSETTEPDHFGQPRRALTADPQQNPMLVDMQNVAAENGLRFRLWTPTTIGTKQFFTNRVNITLKQTDDKAGWLVEKAANDSGATRMSLLPGEFEKASAPVDGPKTVSAPSIDNTPEVDAKSGIRILPQIKLRPGKLY